MTWLRDLEKRLALDVPDYPQIAERHAIDVFDAEIAGSTSNHAGFDVWHRGRKIEIKSKAPRDRDDGYVILRERQFEADAYWFYEFGIHSERDAAPEPSDLRVYEVPTSLLFSERNARDGQAITLKKVRQIGTLIWGSAPEGKAS